MSTPQEDLDMITNHLRKSMENLIGKPTNKKAMVDAVKNVVNRVMKVNEHVDSHEMTYIQVLWKAMTLREKLKWFAYNRWPLKRRGDLERKVIELRHQLRCQEWFEANPDADPCDCPFGLTYPNHLQPNPKSIIVVDMNVKLASPVEFVSFTV